MDIKLLHIIANQTKRGCHLQLCFLAWIVPNFNRHFEVPCGNILKADIIFLSI